MAIKMIHVRTSAASTGTDIGGTDPQQGRREDSSEHYAYIKDPDGNLQPMRDRARCTST